jgi:hypothetical protein
MEIWHGIGSRNSWSSALREYGFSSDRRHFNDQLG